MRRIEPRWREPKVSWKLCEKVGCPSSLSTESGKQPKDYMHVSNLHKRLEK